MNKQNQLSVVSVDEALTEYSIEKLEHLPPFEKAVKLAYGMATVREAMKPHLPMILSLKGSKLGFLCDDGNYTEQQILEAVLTGMFHGARLVGNEINVIAGQCYLTKEYFFRRISEREDVTNLAVETGLPQVLREPSWEKGTDNKNRPVAGSALISMAATWRQNGVPCKLECKRTESSDTRIPIKLNNKYGIDQILGLAESKLLRRVYKRITGSEWVKEDEVDVVPVLEPEAKPESITAAVEKPSLPEEDLDGFRVRAERRFDRCGNQAEINKAMTEILGKHPGDAERLQIVNELAEAREMYLDEMAHATQ